MSFMEGMRMKAIRTLGVLAWGWTACGLCEESYGEPAKEDPDQIVVDLAVGVKMEFLRIKAGSFTMGGAERDMEKPPHKVTISKDFWMQKTLTTQAQWKAVTGGNPSTFKGADLPVEMVSWDDCREFIKKLNVKVKDQLKERVVCLPTEAQFEYACRAGSTTKWSFGEDEAKLPDYAWYFQTAGDQTHPVGQKKPNAWGLYDMHGNAWEWCEDWHGKYGQEAVTDPSGPKQGTLRVIRGGGWTYIASVTRSSAREGQGPSWPGNYNIGFRCALR